MAHDLTDLGNWREAFISAYVRKIIWQGALDTIMFAWNRGDKSTEGIELLCLVKSVKTL